VNGVNIVFMGTSAFAVPALERLLDSRHAVRAVVTQPDRPQGRGQRPAYSPVKQVALAQRLRILQPHRASDPQWLAEIELMAPHVIVVAAYGQLLLPTLLAIPALGCVNVHASLLPKYRGAAPINWALIHGERVTGVSIMVIDETLDTGPILLQSKLVIDPGDNAATLQERMAAHGAETLLRALDGVESGSLKPRPQDHTQATYAPKLRKQDGIISWHRRAVDLANLIRGVTPWPGAVTTHRGKLLRVWRAIPMAMSEVGTPGRIAAIDKRGAWVETGDGYLVLVEVQSASGRRMDTAAYARGHGLHAGDVLGIC
jgi:methionyl-tRNA formyltransferase